MSQLDKQLVWPLDIKPVNDLSSAMKTGITTASYRTGAEIRRTYQDAPLASFDAEFFVSPLLNNYEDEMAWFRFVEYGMRPLLFMNPHRESYPVRVIGTGDGVRTTWVAPFVGWNGDVVVYKNGTMQNDPSIPGSAAKVYSDGPNLLSFGRSLADWNAGDISVDTSCTAVSTRKYLSAGFQYNRGITQIDKIDTPFGGVHVFVDIDLDNTERLNGIADIKGLVGTNAKVYFSTSAGVVSGSLAAISEDEWTALYVSDTATAVKNYSALRTTLETNDLATYYLGAFGITRGDLLTWYPGTVRMPTIVFATPPAKGEQISVHVSKANVMLRMVPRSVAHAIMPDGNRFITVKLEEVPE